MLRYCAPLRWASTTTAAVAAAVSPGPSPLPGGFDLVYIVNLDQRTDRLEAVHRQLQACGINPAHPRVRRYSAVVGRELDPRQLLRAGFLSRLGMRRLARPEHERIWGMDLNGGGLGCALSHVDIWGEVAARRLERVLVLEDDSLIQPSFVADFDAAWRRITAAGLDDEWGLVYVSGLDTAHRGHLLEVHPGVRLVPAMHRTTNAYVLNQRGAAALLDRCVPFTFQLDTEMTTRQSTDVGGGELAVTQVPCYSLDPPLIVQATRFGSDIQGAVSHDLVEEEKGRCAAAGWDAPPPPFASTS